MDVLRAKLKNNSPPDFFAPSCADYPRENGGCRPVGDALTDRDVLLARCAIAEAFYRGGDSLAIAVLASVSLCLYGNVVSGDLRAADLFDELQECAKNLGIAARRQYEVEHAISFGFRRYVEAQC